MIREVDPLLVLQTRLLHVPRHALLEVIAVHLDQTLLYRLELIDCVEFLNRRCSVAAILRLHSVNFLDATS